MFTFKKCLIALSINLAVVSSGFACTTLLVGNEASADGSMLVLAKEWGIGRKAMSRLLEDFSERGLIMNPTHSNPIIEGTGTAETETAATTESEVKGSAENAVVDAADNTPFLEEDSTLSGSRE